MPETNPENVALLVVDIQQKLIPAIDAAEHIIKNTHHLLDAAKILNIPILFTEQNPTGLGSTLTEFEAGRVGEVMTKMTFDACRDAHFLTVLKDKPEIVVVGCETHVCVLQTVLSLLETGRKVGVVGDAVGSRLAANKTVGLNRMQQHGADILSTEMAIFEWLGTADHPHFRDILKIVK